MTFEISLVDDNSESQRYMIKNYDVTKDKNDNDVEILNCTEIVTLANLEKNKSLLQAQLDIVQEKIDAINAL